LASPIPKTIQAAVIRNTGAPWVIEDMELAPLRDDEVLVEMVGCGMCHTDIACRDGDYPVSLPMVVGHEGAGIIRETGAQVDKIKVGDHVVLSFDSCGGCPNCDSDKPAYCYSFFEINTSGRRIADQSTPLTQNGEPINAMFFGQSSFATFAIARMSNAVVIDKSLPLAQMGPLCCGVQTGAGAAVNSLGVGPGNSLLIFGGGAVGLSALLGARAVGAGEVIVVEPNAERRALAMELGATHVIDPSAGGDVLAEVRKLSGGVQFALDTTGRPDVVAVGIEALLTGGQLGLLGIPPADAMLPANMMSMLGRGITVKAIIEGDSDPQEFIPRMAAWYQEGRFPFDRMIKTFPFAQINEAAQASVSGAVVKPVLIF